MRDMERSFWSGSSPRVRGTRFDAIVDDVERGIIPACAGNTRRGRAKHQGARDHPRVCGEHRLSASPSRRTVGSSPRVRGTPRRPHLARAPCWIIPACAGNTWPLRISTRSMSGSSPRVRGTRVRDHHAEHERGIIPACAGNTAVITESPLLFRDHPRVCGEHLHTALRPRRGTGSSPRVRGTRVCRVAFEIEGGIIPACAGNTWGAALQGTWTRDHPRVCGEHQNALFLMRTFQGSSPRVRGTPTAQRWRPAEVGIIPACAGNTIRSLRRNLSSRDHPRVCGEHDWMLKPPVESEGSSPRVRGTLGLRVVDRCRLGIIPACAGNTKPTQ